VIYVENTHGKIAARTSGGEAVASMNHRSTRLATHPSKATQRRRSHATLAPETALDGLTASEAKQLLAA